MPERFVFEGTRINGYWGIYGNSDINGTIWIDCKEELLPIIVEALNSSKEKTGV